MRKHALICLITALCWLCFFTPAHASQLGFDPGDQTVQVGDIVSVDLYISGLGDYAAPSLGAFDIDVMFDPLILEFTGYELGSFLGDLNFSEAYDWSLGETAPGTVNLAELSVLEANDTSGPFYIPPYLDEIQPQNFTLATLSFTALAADVSLLSMVINQLGDAFGDPISDVQFTTGSVTVTSGTAAPVPEPATLFLLGAGLIAVVVAGRKKLGK